MGDVVKGFQRLVDVLDGLAIPFMVGGSVASSVRGIYRATNDIDIVARLSERDIPRLASELGAEFYSDAEMMRDALRRGRAFNVIHYASSAKFDIFPITSDPYSQTQLDRREVEDVVLAEGVNVKCPVASAEDIILAKLVWYRLGGEQSDRQWNDLRGVRAVQRQRLDEDYLRKWAAHLRVQDLLDRLLGEEL
jgi:hypothetical protein